MNLHKCPIRDEIKKKREKGLLPPERVVSGVQYKKWHEPVIIQFGKKKITESEVFSEAGNNRRAAHGMKNTSPERGNKTSCENIKKCLRSCQSKGGGPSAYAKRD